MHQFLNRQFPRHIAFLAIFSAFSMALLALRIIRSHNITYIFLAWNLFLAWMPLLFSFIALEIGKSGKHFAWSALFLVPWLLFLPNAPYLITDLVHLRPRVGIPYWYDISLLASFAFGGVVLGFASLAQVQKLLLMRFRPLWVWFGIALFSFGTGFGVYLGRVQRYNSWDIIDHPGRIFVDVIQPFIHPFAHKETLVMTAVLSTFFFLGYLVFQGLQTSNSNSSISAHLEA